MAEVTLLRPARSNLLHLPPTAYAVGYIPTPLRDSAPKKQSGARRRRPIWLRWCSYFWLISGPACVMLPFTSSVSIFSF